MTSGDMALITQTEAQVAMLAVRVVSFAELIRLVPKGRVDTQSVEAALKAFAMEDVARHTFAAEPTNAQQMAELLAEALVAIEDSPMPHREWGPVTEIMGDGLLAHILGVSTSSIHRYRSGIRPTPDGVAAKLHFVSLIVADLLGSYNDFGVRRWFSRSRSALSSQSPLDILSGRWGPDDKEALRVKALAASLLAPQAT